MLSVERVGAEGGGGAKHGIVLHDEWHRWWLFETVGRRIFQVCSWLSPMRYILLGFCSRVVVFDVQFADGEFVKAGVD